jgi:hypothetical protein
MLEALSTLLSKSFDIFLKLNSKDARKRKLGKMLFEVYTGLGLVITALANLRQDIQRYTGPESDDALLSDLELPEGMVLRSASSTGTYEVSVREFDFEGRLHVSKPKTFNRQEILSLAVRRHVADFAAGVHQFARPLEHEARDWFQLGHQPKRLQALGIYDPELVHTYTRAWFGDGGFVEALRKLGFEAEFSSKVIRLVDAAFDPTSKRFGYEVKPSTEAFDLTKPNDVTRLNGRIQATERVAQEARESLRALLDKNFSLEDLI